MKRLLLLGAGSAHLQVLQAIRRDALAGAEVTLVAPAPRSFRPGLLPAFVAGRLSAEACSVALEPLAAVARVRLFVAGVTALDAAARRVTLADGQVIDYDLLSLDGGTTAPRDAIPGAREHGLFLRPLDSFVRLFDGLVDLAARRVLDVVVIGSDAAAAALALALQQRLARHDEPARIALVTGGALPAATARLRAQRITVVHEACTAIDGRAVHLANGARLACDAPIVATAAAPPAWLAGSGLALDEQGFVAINANLQSVSHTPVFAAGAMAQQAGAALALNLRRAVGGGELQPWRPRRWAAPAAVGNGGWIDRWHERRERDFVARCAATPSA